MKKTKKIKVTKDKSQGADWVHGPWTFGEDGWVKRKEKPLQVKETSEDVEDAFDTFSDHFLELISKSTSESVPGPDIFEDDQLVTMDETVDVDDSVVYEVAYNDSDDYDDSEFNEAVDSDSDVVEELAVTAPIAVPTSSSDERNKRLSELKERMSNKKTWK